MFDGFLSTLGMILSVLTASGSVSASVEPSALTVAAAVLAAVLVAAAMGSLSLPSSSAASGPHPLRGIDVSSPLAQSDPDASGHARPRAPGGVASAAA